MTEERLVLADLLEKAGDGDFLRAVAEAVLQLLMESDVEGMIGAGRYERSGERTTWRNGYRDRTLDTRLGSLQLRIPKLRQGSYFPPFLEARKSSEKARARPRRHPIVVRQVPGARQRPAGPALGAGSGVATADQPTQ
jgi:putative transposase